MQIEGVFELVNWVHRRLMSSTYQDKNGPFQYCRTHGRIILFSNIYETNDFKHKIPCRVNREWFLIFDHNESTNTL